MKQINIKIKKYCLVLAVLFLAVACNNAPDDKTIQDNVNKQIRANTGYNTVNATVKEGVVMLTGTCEGENCAAELEKSLKEIEGVNRVDNKVQVNTGTDLTLRTSVQNIISKYEGVQADVASGVIVLRGTIDRNQVQPLMNELAALQPKKIDNQLAVK